jgi:hypothetical protein
MIKFLVAVVLLGTSLFSNAEIVTVPIPGAPGLSVTVGTGVNALPLQDIRSNPNVVNITSGDDDYRNVPLGFDFPYWGRTFNNSWAMTNGMVTFVDPTQSGIYGACCSGVDLSTTRDTRWNYSIFAVHTDLYSWNGQNQYYLRENNTMTYGWYNLSQCCSSNGGNSFEIKINSSGGVDTRIAGALVNWNAVTSGMSGDLSKGEYYQYYHGQGLNINTTTGGVSWNTIGGFTGTDICLSDPLSSPSCPGYFTAQCTVSVLYNPSCPGYAAAYFTQQCSLNSLYDINCPGYAAAYLNYQCSVSPLYSTTCEGYENAYFNQQCSANALYSTSCPGYAEAYHAQQCSVNGLYSTTCPNYATAYATQQALRRTNNPPSTTSITTNATQDSSSNVSVPVVSDSNVNQVITSTATSASPAAAATATVPLVAAPVTTAAAPTAKAEEKKPDATSPSSPSSTTAQNTSTETKAAAPTARQELQAKREAVARAKAVEEGKNLASNMGKVADIETQKQIQNVVIAAMGFTPGFDVYSTVVIKDVVGYKPFTVYNNQNNVDNRRLGMGLYGPSDKLHNEIIESQYNRGN